MTMLAVMTAAPRDPHTQRRSLDSVKRAGFSPHIVAEPGVDVRGVFAGVPVHNAAVRQGQWANFMRALHIGLWLGKDRFLTCEDDVLFCAGTADALSCMELPRQCGCLLAYTAAAYSDYPPGLSRLSVENALDMLGACALVFPAAVAKQLESWGIEKGWRGDPYNTVDEQVQKKAADTFVGEVLTFLGWEIWIHNPSFAQHIGDESTLGHHLHGLDSRRRTALAWPGEHVDARTICNW